MNGTVYNYRVEGARYGISFGTALAIAISYTTNQSILWAIIHGRPAGRNLSFLPGYVPASGGLLIAASSG